MKISKSVFPYHRNLALWTDRVFPLIRAVLKTGYFSLEISGLENVPTEERVIYVANHSSWLALDGLLVPFALHSRIAPEHLPYGIIHDILFKLPFVGQFFFHCGAIPVSWVRDLKKIPKHIGSLGIFPEGDEGNSKPFWEAYQMRRWKKGFIKLALDRKMRVVPLAIQGLEESMPVAFTIKSFKPLFGTFAGYPLIPFPLPSKFKISFLRPVDLSLYSKEVLNSSEGLDRIADEIRFIVQAALDQEVDRKPLARFSRFVSQLK